MRAQLIVEVFAGLFCCHAHAEEILENHASYTVRMKRENKGSRPYEVRCQIDKSLSNCGCNVVINLHNLTFFA